MAGEIADLVIMLLATEATAARQDLKESGP
jgi:hypothetical protein